MRMFQMNGLIPTQIFSFNGWECVFQCRLKLQDVSLMMKRISINICCKVFIARCISSSLQETTLFSWWVRLDTWIRRRTFATYKHMIKNIWLKRIVDIMNFHWNYSTVNRTFVDTSHTCTSSLITWRRHFDTDNSLENRSDQFLYQETIVLNWTGDTHFIEYSLSVQPSKMLTECDAWIFDLEGVFVPVSNRRICFNKISGVSINL